MADRVDATIRGGNINFDDYLNVANPATPPSFIVPKTFIEANRDLALTATYIVARAAGGNATSQPLAFRIGVTEPFAIDDSLVEIVGVGGEHTRNATGGTPPYIYSSNNANSVLVPDPSQGRIRGVATGTAFITARDSAQGVGSYPVLVTSNAPPFAIDPSPVNLSGTESYTRDATGGTPPYTYTSSQPIVVAVPNPNAGLIRAASDGDATITASDAAGGVGSYSVHVSGNTPFYIDPSFVALTGTASYTRHAIGGKQPYTYTSEQPGIVEVPNANAGIIRGVANGDARIIARDSASAWGTYQVWVSGIEPPVLIEDFRLQPQRYLALGQPVALATMTVRLIVEAATFQGTSGNTAGLDIGRRPGGITYGGTVRFELKTSCRSISITGYIGFIRYQVVYARFYGIDGAILQTIPIEGEHGTPIAITFTASDQTRISHVDVVVADADIYLYNMQLKT